MVHHIKESFKLFFMSYEVLSREHKNKQISKQNALIKANMATII